MSEIPNDDLERVIRDSGESWLIDWYTPRENAIVDLREKLFLASERARNRYPHDPPSLSPDAIIREYDRNPHRVRALFQILGSVGSLDILVMVSRILQGSEIEKLEVKYVYENEFSLYVRLNSPYDPIEQDDYHTSDIDDAVILRHLGTLKMDGQPIFDGFYPLRR